MCNHTCAHTPAHAHKCTQRHTCCANTHNTAALTAARGRTLQCQSRSTCPVCVLARDEVATIPARLLPNLKQRTIQCANHVRGPRKLLELRHDDLLLISSGPDDHLILDRNKRLQDTVCIQLHRPLLCSRYVYLCQRIMM